MDLPNLALENISERTSLSPSDFQEGNPSAFDVITIITRQYAIGYMALGLMAFLVVLNGYRSGSRWAWITMWVVVAALIAIAANYMLIGGIAGAGIIYLGLAIVALVGQLLILGGRSR